MFYVQQRRAALRNDDDLQDFSFELSYYLNHYYLLLWAGLDQLCWILNGVYVFGLNEKDHGKIGFFNKKFLKILKNRAPEVHELFKNSKYTQWAKMLMSVRHFVAHQGIAMASDIYLKPEIELSDEEIDQEVNANEDWLEMKRLLPPGVLESFRPLERIKAKLQKMEKLPEPIAPIKIDGKAGFIFPLVNVEWDFECFFEFTSKVSSCLVEKLKEKS